jgi:hypothetical protein
MLNTATGPIMAFQLFAESIGVGPEPDPGIHSSKERWVVAKAPRSHPRIATPDHHEDRASQDTDGHDKPAAMST